ncbi:ABC transporter permease [candidate division KSB1 bacterium]
MKRTKIKPPKFAFWILKKIALAEDKTAVLGDLEEDFIFNSERTGKISAYLTMWIQVLRSVFSFLKYFIFWRFYMFKNYLKIAFRTLLKQKTTSIINVIGLSIGMAFCILIYLFIRDELSFDRFHKNADSIYSVVSTNHYIERSHRHLPVPFAPVLKENFPEVKNYVRLIRRWDIPVRYKNNLFNETIHIADPQIFDVFSFKLETGDPGSILNSDNSVILDRSTATKYFGNENPIGKILRFTFGEKQKLFTVCGILKEIPSNSSIRFSILISIQNLDFIFSSDAFDNWRINLAQSFLLIDKTADPEYIENNILRIVKPYLSQTYENMRRWGLLVKDGETMTYDLQNLKEMHLNSPNIFGLARSNIKRSYILTGIAVLILFIAVINFINMSIGKAAGRGPETGVRKVLGAGRKQLVSQFLSESIVITLISVIAGICIVAFMIPAFNLLAGKHLTLNSLFNMNNVAVFFFLMVTVGIFAGSFPAFVLSNVKIVDIFSGKFKLRRNNSFTKILVIFQFTMSIFLLISSLIMSKQIGFLKDYDLGYDKEGVLVVDLQERDVLKSQALFKLFKERIRSYNTVVSVSGSLNSPNRTLLLTTVNTEGENINAYYSKVHYDYIKTMNMTLLKGRDFSGEFSSDTSSVIVNQKLVSELGMENPVGKTITMGPEPPVKIIGVVKDFNYLSLTEEAGPAVLNMDPSLELTYAVIRISPQDITETIKFLGNVWRDIEPEKPFEYSFLEDDIEQFYTSENRWNSIVRYSSLFTVLIASIGVFGLTLITVNSRIKEIGIRKVFGASVSNIIGLVTKEIFFLVIAANIIAWPSAWFIMDKWLNGFAYKTGMSIGLFLYGGLLVLLVSMLTISYQIIKAARRNPVDSLKYE